MVFKILITFLLTTINIYSSTLENKKINKINNEKEKKSFLKERDKSEITNILSTTTKQQTILDRIAEKLVFDIKGNPLLILPIADSSKDLGVNLGIMPVLAIRNQKKQEVSSVIAPSINYNKYLGYTYTYRHYLFPTEKSLVVLRASISDNAQKEYFFHYFNPEIFSTKIRTNLEFRNWHNPKSSFYGIGADSSKGDKANYIFYLKGGELSLSIPLFNFIFFDYTPSYYKNMIKDGIVGSEKFSQRYPEEYQSYSKEKSFFINRFSLFFDSTDHPFIPKIGKYLIFSMGISKKSLGSDYDFNLYSLELKNYYNYKFLDSSITATRVKLEWQTGEKIPFYVMPTVGESTGLRMAGDGRFVDRAKLIFNIEQRFTIVKAPVMKFLTELEITPFLDVGTVGGSVSKLSFSRLKYGPGVAFRIVLRPQIVGTADLAFGNEGFNTIIKINYPF